MLSTFIIIFLCVVSLLDHVNVPQGYPVVVLQGDGSAQPVTFLSWDTEGGDRAAMNLLYDPISLFVQTDGVWTPVLADGRQSYWSVTQDGATITICVHTEDSKIARLRLVFPFNPRVAATTFLPTGWTGCNEMQLPGIISTPDFGQMRLSANGHEGVRAALLGSRVGDHTIDLQLEWPAGGDGTSDMVFTLDPVWLSMPTGFDDDEMWRAIRRGWFNMLQPSSQWGKPGRTQSAPPGLLSNNVVSDPVSCVLHMAADHVLLKTELAPGISAAVPLRNTVDWWLDNGIAENGEMVSWRNVRGMLDANAGTYGRPVQEDGSDTFQQYLNGGCCVSDTYYFLTALYMLSLRDRADRILSAMLERHVEGVFENGGGFQNGVVDEFPRGAEFYDWSGNTTGYEGHLVYSFSFLQAVLYRDESLRHKVLRPLWER